MTAEPILNVPLIVNVSSALKSVIVRSLTDEEIFIESLPSPEVIVAPDLFAVITSSPAPALIESAPFEVIVSFAEVALTIQAREFVLIICAADVEAV